MPAFKVDGIIRGIVKLYPVCAVTLGGFYCCDFADVYRLQFSDRGIGRAGKSMGSICCAGGGACVEIILSVRACSVGYVFTYGRIQFDYLVCHRRHICEHKLIFGSGQGEGSMRLTVGSFTSGKEYDLIFARLY